jgi:cation diffusion facilitator CzcD-associated flavoprotein CzcO
LEGVLADVELHPQVRHFLEELFRRAGEEAPRRGRPYEDIRILAGRRSQERPDEGRERLTRAAMRQLLWAARLTLSLQAVYPPFARSALALVAVLVRATSISCISSCRRLRQEALVARSSTEACLRVAGSERAGMVAVLGVLLTAPGKTPLISASRAGGEEQRVNALEQLACYSRGVGFEDPGGVDLS